MTDSSDESSEGEAGFWGEDGQWHYYDAKPTPLSEEQRVYGIWADDDTNNSQSLLPPRKKHRTNNYSRNNTLRFNFVSGGIQTEEELNANINNLNTNNTNNNNTTTTTAITANNTNDTITTTDQPTVSNIDRDILNTSTNITSNPNLKRVKLGSHGLPTSFGSSSTFTSSTTTATTTKAPDSNAFLWNNRNTSILNNNNNNNNNITNTNAMEEKNEKQIFVPPQVDTDFGSWQRHTHGFGMKMLSKMGFRGRLGKFEQGIANPIKAAPTRKGTEGLGARKGGEQVWNQAKTAQEELEEMKKKIMEHRKLEEEKERQNDLLLDNLSDEGEDVATIDLDSYKKRPKKKIMYQSASEYLKNINQKNERTFPDSGSDSNLLSTMKRSQQILHDYTKSSEAQLTSLDQHTQLKLKKHQRTTYGEHRNHICPELRNNVDMLIQITKEEILKMDRNIKVMENHQQTLQTYMKQVQHTEEVQESYVKKLGELKSLVESMLIMMTSNLPEKSKVDGKNQDNFDFTLQRPSKNNQFTHASKSNLKKFGEKKPSTHPQVHSDVSQCTSVELAKKIAELQTKYQNEYKRFHLWKLIPTIVFPRIRWELQRDWQDVLGNPQIGVSYLKQWQPLLTRNEKHGHLDDHDENISSDSEARFGSHIAVESYQRRRKKELFTDLIEQVFFPWLKEQIFDIDDQDHTYISEQLASHQLFTRPQLYVELLTQMQPYMPEQVYRDMLQKFIIHNLKLYVQEKWSVEDAAAQVQSLCLWMDPQVVPRDMIQPILVLLRSKLKEYFRQIWKLKDYETNDIGLIALREWSKPGLYYEHMEEFEWIIKKYVMPKCVSYLKYCASQMDSEIGIQDISTVQINETEPMKRFDKVLRWTQEHLLTMPQFISVLQSGFLPKWLALIHKRLNAKKDQKIERVWKNIYDVWQKKIVDVIPNPIDPAVEEYFATALDMINCCIEHERLPELELILSTMTIDVENMDDIPEKEKKTKKEDATPLNIDNENEEITRIEPKHTFKETIQEFAESQYLLFQPKLFQMVDGQQVYTFGKVSIYLSDECVFMKDKKTHTWKPVSLKELIVEAK